jgi:hypothetical protein
MAKWEYLTLERTPRTGDPFELTINGRPDERTRNMDVAIALNWLGWDGWELVAAHDNAVFTFKRPVR